MRRQAAVQGGAPFAAILVDQPHEQAAAVTAFLAEVAGPETRVVRMHDPTQPHRTLQRIVDQVAGPAGEVFRGDQARLMVRAVAERQAQERRVLLVIERAETLRPELLRSLQTMAPYFAESQQPALQVLFVGRPIFRMLLDQQSMAPLRRALESGTNVAGPDMATQPRRSSRKPLLLLVALLVGAAGAGYFALRDPPPSFDRGLRATDIQPPPEASPSLPETLPPPDRALPGATGLVAPPPGIAPPGIAPPGIAPPGIAPPGIAPPGIAPPAIDPSAIAPPAIEPPAEVAPARPAIPAGPRIVIHVPSGSDGAEALSARLVVALKPKSGTVEVRRVPETPSRPSLRYFYAGDEPAARQTAARAAEAGLNCVVQDFSSYRPLPSRGTIEVWLPRPNERNLASRSDPEQVN